MSADELIPGFRPENELERDVGADERLLEGMAWGEPRSGHPEGRVGAHVGDLLRSLEGWDEPADRRSQLRFITIVHDAFKNRVRSCLPRSGENHHAMRARRFAEEFTDDERLLTTIELHDRPYQIWRRMARKGKLDRDAFEEMMERIPDERLFLRFIELDGSTDGKNPEPIRWFREQLEARAGETAGA